MKPTKADWESARIPSVAEVVRGAVDDADVAYGREKITHALHVTAEPVLRTELRIVVHEDPARVQSSFVEMHALVNGQPVRARASAPTVHEAIDRCTERFQHRISRCRDRIAARHERLYQDEGWRHGDSARNHARPAGVYMRDPDSRRLVRRKLFALTAESIDEAVDDLELLDHDFFLFINVATDEPNLVARDGDRFRLWQPRPSTDHDGVVAPVDFDPAVAPVCTIEEARALLALHDDSALPAFVFFVDVTSGQGAVVYRRRDGHDGLITAR